MKSWIVPVWAWGVLLGTGISFIVVWPSWFTWIFFGLGFLVLVWRVFYKPIDLQLMILALLIGLFMGHFRAMWWDWQRRGVTSGELTGVAVVTELRRHGFGWQVTLTWDKPGPFSATTARVYEELQVGTVVDGSCQLELIQPAGWNDRAYGQLAQGVVGECTETRFEAIAIPPQILVFQLLTHPNRFTLTALAATLRHNVQEHITQAYNPPVSWLASGLLIGERGEWSQSFTKIFQRVGLSHIVALSGWNVTVLSSLLLWVLIRCGCSNRLAALGGIVFVVGFVVLTGASPSLVRAALMFGICVLARILARPQPALRVLLMTAALMVWSNPALLLWDISFQLSLLATLALVIGGWSFFESFEAPVWEVSQTIRTTVAVTLLTLPYVIWRFGQFSLISIPLNVFVLPLLPLATAGAALGTLMSWLGFHSTTFFWITGLPMQLIITSAQFAAQLPWASVSWE